MKLYMNVIKKASISNRKRDIDSLNCYQERLLLLYFHLIVSNKVLRVSVNSRVKFLPYKSRSHSKIQGH